MVLTRLAPYLLVFLPMLAATNPACAQRPAQAKPPKVRLKLGRCDQQVTYNLPAQRFDETATAIARATGCYIRYPNHSLMTVPVQAVRGRLTRRQALRVALRGTDLRVVRETPDLMEVARVPAAPARK